MIVIDTCSDLSEPVQTCPNLSKFVHNTVTMHAMSIFPFQKLLFFSLAFYPAEIAYLNPPNRELSNGVRLVELYWNKIVDPSGSPYYSDYLCFSRNVNFCPFESFLFFSLMSYPAEIAYFSSPNWELSHLVRFVQVYWNKNVDPSRSPCLKIVDRKSFERRNFLVLHPVLLKNAYSAQLIDSFSTTYGSWSCDKGKLSIPQEAHHYAQLSEVVKPKS